MLWFGQAIATAEALLLARHAGIDLDVLRQALMDSAASSAFIPDNLGALLAGDYMTGFGLDRCCEELTTVTALGREHDVPFELSALVEQTHQRALTRYGPADGELLAVALLEERSQDPAARRPSVKVGDTHDMRDDPARREPHRRTTASRRGPPPAC
jgi:3-hydroxyisobutyrate dehydrogenase